MTTATTTLLPWFTRDADGRWTGHDYPTEQAALDAAGPGETVWEDNHVVGLRGWGSPSRHVNNGR